MRDFGEILEQWERKQKKQSAGTDDADTLPTIIDQYPPDESDIPEEDLGQDSSEGREEFRKRQSLKRLPPEDSLDLHGMSAGHARRSIRRFLTESRARGLKKVLIVHGKGNHSRQEPILKRVTIEELEASAIAGQTGTPSRELGGSGAIWVAIKSE